MSGLHGNIPDGGIVSVMSTSILLDVFAATNGVPLTTASNVVRTARQINGFGLISRSSGWSSSLEKSIVIRQGSWRIECNMDWNVWNALDSRHNNSKLKRRDVIKSWSTGIEMTG
jgi:hypothetical protein